MSEPTWKPAPFLAVALDDGHIQILGTAKTFAAAEKVLRDTKWVTAYYAILTPESWYTIRWGRDVNKLKQTAFIEESSRESQAAVPKEALAAFIQEEWVEPPLSPYAEAQNVILGLLAERFGIEVPK